MKNISKSYRNAVFEFLGTDVMKKYLAVFLLLLSSIFCLPDAYALAPKALVNAQVVDVGGWPAQYKISLAVPKDHHAYLDKGEENIYLPVTFDSDGKLAPLGLAISKLDKPSGVYDAEVKATVLRDQGVFSLALDKVGDAVKPKSVTLSIQYQLCNDVTHVCFRPQNTQVDLTLPTALSTSKSGNPGEETVGFTDKLMALFKNNQDNTLIMFGLMLMAGLLSVATPCVYPMLPITSMFIINRANGHAEKEKQHALVYMLGMVATYIALGLMAGMTGGAFNTFMQSAWVNLAFAVFFAFFAIALLGFYELSFMQNEVHALDQKTARVKGLGGTWLMGAVAGLAISPCVGPIVFALLLQVADRIAAKADALALVNQSLGFWDKFAIASQGGMMMGGFGLGVALPFFIISVVKFRKLPKAGYWMNKIKYAFGFVILYFAYVYFGKGMGVLGVEPAVTRSLALGMVAIWIAVVHCQVLTLLPRDAIPNEKMHHYCGVIALLIGIWLIIAGLGHLHLINDADAMAPMAAKQTGQLLSAKIEKKVQKEAGISWYRNFEEAQKVAQHTGKPIFIDFYASWCANCAAFKDETASNLLLNKVLREKAIAVKLIDKEPDFEKFRMRPEHRQLKIGLPYFAILTPDGKVTWSGSDYKATDKMVTVLSGAAT